MTTTQLLLILSSGLGVLHGTIFCIFLWNYSKSGLIQNKILAVLLLVLSLRVGKSVWLYFSEDLSITIIFLGLALILSIGPLFLNYFKAITLQQNPKWKDAYHYFPMFSAIFFGLWIDNEVSKSISVNFFILIFIFYYGHMLIYLLHVLLKINSQRKEFKSSSTIEWLTIINYALLAIWLIYVANLFEKSIPYLIGPIFYSFLIYGITFLAIKKSYLSQNYIKKYRSTPVSESEIEQLYCAINDLLIEQELYLNAELSLDVLSQKLKVTTQKISMVINIKSGINFNQFINRFRIGKAKELLLKLEYKHLTIAAIAYEVGFNSINSFNQAFKLETGTTPSGFRKYEDN